MFPGSLLRRCFDLTCQHREALDFETLVTISLRNALCGGLISSAAARALHHVLDPADGQYRYDKEDRDKPHALLNDKVLDGSTSATMEHPISFA